MKYAGRSFTLAPGEKLEHVNEACKNHLLTGFGNRGLVALGYSDHGHEEEIGKSARKTNEDFKKRQIRIYNETNEQRKLSRMGYLPPPKKVKEYAVELGITLLEPYTMKDEEKAAIAGNTIENEILKQKLAAQEKEMAELKEMMKQFMSKPVQRELEPDPALVVPGVGILKEKSEARVKVNGKWVKEG